jgi:hypothetical protein
MGLWLPDQRQQQNEVSAQNFVERWVVLSDALTVLLSEEMSMDSLSRRYLMTGVLPMERRVP